MDKTRTFKQEWVKVGSFKMMPRRSEPRPEDVVWVSRRLPGTSAEPRALSGALAQPVIGYATVDLESLSYGAGLSAPPGPPPVDPTRHSMAVDSRAPHLSISPQDDRYAGSAGNYLDASADVKELERRQHEVQAYKQYQEQLAHELVKLQRLLAAQSAVAAGPRPSSPAAAAHEETGGEETGGAAGAQQRQSVKEIVKVIEERE